MIFKKNLHLESFSHFLLVVFYYFYQMLFQPPENRQTTPSLKATALTLTLNPKKPGGKIYRGGIYL